MKNATRTPAEKATKTELISKMKKLSEYTRKVVNDNAELKKDNILQYIITEKGITPFSIKNYVQDELVLRCHQNQNQYTIPMSKKDSFMLLFVTNIYMINQYCDYLEIEEKENDNVYVITLNPDAMPDNVKGFYNYKYNCNFTTNKQKIEQLKAEELQEISSILQSYGYDIEQLIK